MLRTTLKNFRQDRSGTVAIIFAMTLATVVTVIGGAVDYGRWLSASAQTTQAMDAAVLAAGRVLQIEGGDEVKALAAAQKYYDQNKSHLLDVDNISFSFENGELTISMSASKINTPFLAIAGISELPINNVSKAIISAGGNAGSHVEIAMMLDVTGSMCGGWPYDCTSAAKLDAMKAAAKDLVKIVVWDDQAEFTSRVALVPFSEHVNVGRTYFQKITNVNPGGTGDERTCIRERTNSNRYKPKKPNASNGYFTHYSQSSGTCKPSTTIMPLTSDKVALNAHIDSFAGKGGTAGHLGTQFAWYALHPGWGSVWGNASKGKSYSLINEMNEYGKPKLYKIAILMTDGEFNKKYDGDNSETQAREFCTAMKNKDIIVYTVGFEIGSSGSAYNTMSQCATSEGHFYNATNGDQLRMAFRDIALQVSTLRISE
jgi:Flp pilus assembly protein TadG